MKFLKYILALPVILITAIYFTGCCSEITRDENFVHTVQDSNWINTDSTKSYMYNFYKYKTGNVLILAPEIIYIAHNKIASGPPFWPFVKSSTDYENKLYSTEIAVCFQSIGDTSFIDLSKIRIKFPNDSVYYSVKIIRAKNRKIDTIATMYQMPQVKEFNPILSDSTEYIYLTFTAKFLTQTSLELDFGELRNGNKTFKIPVFKYYKVSEDNYIPFPLTN